MPQRKTLNQEDNAVVIRALDRAIQADDMARVMELLAIPGININDTNRFGEVPLHMAVIRDRIEIVKLLLNQPGVDVNIGTAKSEYGGPYGETPLGLAVYKVHPEIVKLLLDDPRVDVNKADIYGLTPLHHVEVRGNSGSYFQILKLLLDHPRIDVNKVDKHGNTPLHVLDADLIKLMLDDPRVKVNEVNKDGETPFFNAVSRVHINTVKALLNDPRVDVNKENKKGVAPLYYAAYYRLVEIVKLLLDDPRTVVDQRTKNDLRDGKFISEIAELFAPLVPLQVRNIPKNATNAIMLNDIAEGDEMVNFHGESGHGRYYKKSSYNALPSKVNPYTRTPIAPTNVARYKAHLVDPARPAPTNFVEEAKPDTTNFVEEAKRIFREKLGQRAGSRKTRRGNRSGNKTRRGSRSKSRRRA
jgi:ankyrin repeat protein